MITQRAGGREVGDKVVIAEKIATAGIETLAERFDIDLAYGVDADELARRVSRASALVVRSATVVDAALIAAGTELRVVGRAGIGVDNIDIEAATRAGVLVVNAPDANTISAAEHTMALLLSQARRIPAADASLRQGKWERSRFQGIELHGKTLAVLGLGRIGSLVAQRALAFGMRVTAFDPFISEEWGQRLGVEMGDLSSVIGGADFVTLHLPRTHETENLIDADAIASMRDGVRIVNVARGGIVDEEALADAVRSGHVAGAAVDVFAVEPTTSSPLFVLEDVVVTPHLGASTAEAQDKAGLAVAEAVAAALDGELVSSAVNFDVGVHTSDEVRPFLNLAVQLGSIFATFAAGLPPELTIAASGTLAEHSVRPLALGALRGALDAVSDESVSYVNVTRVAEERGVAVVETAVAEAEGYQTVLSLAGLVNDRPCSVSGTVLASKGPVLVEVDGHGIEFPLAEHMLLLRNEDVPGVIGLVGSVLGDAGVNIADMAVGRHSDGTAMMGLALDSAVAASVLEDLRALPGVVVARYIKPG
ncbi:MAG: phosphoglycerate dehydrogenase [Acidimicrobiia bacterium]